MKTTLSIIILICLLSSCNKETINPKQLKVEKIIPVDKDGKELIPVKVQ